MSSMPEPGRLVAHVYLDAVVAYEEGAGRPVNESAMNLALTQLGSIDAVDFADDGGLDVSNLTMPAVVCMNYLATALANARGTSRETILGELRTFVDTYE